MAKTLDELFNQKTTENGDIAFNSTLNPMLDILFMTEYYKTRCNEVHIGDSDRERLFSMFIRDPRYGLGMRDLGRELMKQSHASLEQIVKAGRFDDIFAIFKDDKEVFHQALDYLKNEVANGNELVKKWMPRYSSKNLMLAREIAKYWGMNKQEYGHFIKAKTVERTLSAKNGSMIEFSKVPSLAMLKYYKRFAKGADTSKKFAKYLEDVKDGKAKLNVSTSTVYDIYKNRKTIDADLFFSKIEKISGSWIPIVDSSGSMQDGNDSYGKALAIGHYLAKCSSYAPDRVISFSSYPQLLTLGRNNPIHRHGYYEHTVTTQDLSGYKTQYERELASMHTGDCSNTDFGAVMELLKGLENTPDFLVVLTDMEFDSGSRYSKDELKRLWAEKGYTTKIVWWNLNSRATTCPEVDSEGNVFLSGYNPMLLKYLGAGFDGQKFLDVLLDEYEKIISNPLHV